MGNNRKFRECVAVETVSTRHNHLERLPLLDAEPAMMFVRSRVKVQEHELLPRPEIEKDVFL